jgi:SAM-dependent methyltransferase
MLHPGHQSAAHDHYTQQAAQYDVLNVGQTTAINKTLESIFASHQVRSVLDLTCGTGAQVEYFRARGFEIEGYDICDAMIDVANAKGLECKLGDMRTTRAGHFDAVITIFNAVGHLTREDFAIAMQNVRANLNDGGLYVFDIFNLEYLLAGDNITKLTIDWIEQGVRKIQYSTIDETGVLASYDTLYLAGQVTQSSQTLQVYKVEWLEEMLGAQGFDVIDVRDVDGCEFCREGSERMLVVAQFVSA